MSNRWDISKRFHKYTEKLLSAPEEKLEELIQTFLRAVKEVLEQGEFRYYLGDEHYWMNRGKLHCESAEYPAERLACYQLALDPVTGKQHLLFADPEPLVGNKLEYFQLMLQQYQLILQKTLDGKKPSAPEAVEADRSKPLEGSIRAKYRRQKEVILALEHYAKKQNPHSRILQDIKELPDLEEEIIHFQNKLIQDLAEARKKAFDARQERERMSRFTQIFMDEMSHRTAMVWGLLRLFDKGSEKSGFNVNALAAEQMRSMKSFFDAIVESIETEHQRGFLTPSEFTCQDWVHGALSLIQESEEGQSLTVELDPRLAEHRVLGDYPMLRQAMAHFFQYMARLHQMADAEATLHLKISPQERQGGVSLRIVASNIPLTEEVASQTQRPKSLYHTLNLGFVAPSLLLYFASQAVERHGGRIDLLAKEGDRIDCMIRLENLSAKVQEGEEKEAEPGDRPESEERREDSPRD